MGSIVITGVILQGLLYGLMVLGVYISFRVLNFPDLTVDGSFTLGAGTAAILIASGVDPILATLIAPVAGWLAEWSPASCTAISGLRRCLPAS